MTPRQKQILAQAASLLEPNDLKVFFEVRRMFPLARLPLASEETRAQFEKHYCHFYKMDARIWLQEDKRLYFDLLYGLSFKPSDWPHAQLLQTLRECRGKMEFSFVSKIVSTHDEKRPLWDCHVKRFFNLKDPIRTKTEEQRVQEFKRHLSLIRQSYRSWIGDFGDVAHKMMDRIEPLWECHVYRVCDILVWTAGKKGLL